MKPSTKLLGSSVSVCIGLSQGRKACNLIIFAVPANFPKRGILPYPRQEAPMWLPGRGPRLFLGIQCMEENTWEGGEFGSEGPGEVGGSGDRDTSVRSSVFPWKDKRAEKGLNLNVKRSSAGSQALNYKSCIGQGLGKGSRKPYREPDLTSFSHPVAKIQLHRYCNWEINFQAIFLHFPTYTRPSPVRVEFKFFPFGPSIKIFPILKDILQRCLFWLGGGFSRIEKPTTKEWEHSEMESSIPETFNRRL